MNLLLDTHALAWWVLDDKRLSHTARTVIASPQSEIVVSVVSSFEMATKHRLGKWPEIGEFTRKFHRAVPAEGFRIINIAVDHTILAGLMPGKHRDPFDRLLAAQAQIEGMQLVTNDPAFDEFLVETVW